MSAAKPSIGRIVHYTSYGTSGGEYPKACRAALITEVNYGTAYERDNVALTVFNPTGMFFNPHVPFDVEGVGCPGTWHWPEKLEEV